MNLTEHFSLQNISQRVERSVVSYVINLCLPIPALNKYLSDKILLFKDQLIVIFLCLILFGTMSLFGFKKTVIASVTNLPPSLSDYREEGYDDTNIPKGSVVGGDKMEFTQITAYYRDPTYYEYFHRWHNGIDGIPSGTYYLKNKAFLSTKEIIIVATLSGIACSSGDTINGYQITIVSKDGTYRTLYHHQKINFIQVGKCMSILAGQPIGIMGQTGNATGIHCHYMVYKRDQLSQSWIEQDPVQFL